MPRGKQGRWQRDPRAGWLGAAALLAALFAGLVVVVLASPSVDRVDAFLSAAVRALQNPQLTQLAIGITQLGGGWVIVAGTVAASVLLLIRGKTAAVVYLVCTVGGGWFLGNVVIKNIVDRMRPQDVALIDLPRGFSLPSGHSLASFLLYASLAVIVVLNVDGQTAKVAAIVGAAVIIGAVGLSRVYLGVHWVGDVAAAWLFGGAWWAFCTATYLASVTEHQRGAYGRQRP